MINTAEINDSDTFIAMLMHDLKTPINAEILALELLIDKEQEFMSQFQFEMLQDILSSTKYMKQMTENALMKYKINNGSLQLIKTDCSLEELIYGCMKDVKHLACDKNQKIIFECGEINSEINIDFLEIKRVIQNLLTNAIDYAPKNSEIIIRLYYENNHINCTITDFGCGIDLENPNDIFNKYLSLAKQKKKLGTGLGLYIAKEIIEAHEGTIGVQTKINEGTTITFSLPY